VVIILLSTTAKKSFGFNIKEDKLVVLFWSEFIYDVFDGELCEVLGVSVDLDCCGAGGEEAAFESEYA